MTEKQKYWLEDVQGNHHIFEAEDRKAAYHYFMMEGDHAYDYGLADKEYFVERLKGE
jgi:hypothetical protein